MRTKRWTAGIVWMAMGLGLGLGVCGAQQTDELKPLRHGRVVIWVVTPKPGKPHVQSPLEFTPSTYKESTAGSFGTSASDYGTSASNVGVSSMSPTISRTGRVPPNTAPADVDAAAAEQAGLKQQTSGSFGQTASSYGKAASDTGKTAGSFGQTASTYGTAASNVGTNAGDFGNSLSTLDKANAPKVPQAPASVAPVLAPRLTADFPALRTQYVKVTDDRLPDLLRQASGHTNYPDVVIFDGFAADWQGPELESGVVVTRGGGRYYALNKAQHPEAAQALVGYLDKLADAK